MIRLFPEQVDDLLDVNSLPPTDRTELNYRTRPLTAGQETRLATLLVFGSLPIVAMASAAMWTITLLPWIDNMVFAACPVLLALIFFRRLTGAAVRWQLIIAFVFIVSSLGGELWGLAQRGEGRSWWIAMLAGWITSALIARQMAAWILVSPTVDHETMARWRVNLPGIIPRGLSLDCPELLSFYVSPILLFVAARLNAELPVDVWCWPLTFPMCLHAVWWIWHIVAIAFIPWPSWKQSWIMSWRALVVFTTYDIYWTPAAGVFRFPTRILRCPWNRWVLLIGALVAIGFGYSAACPSPLVMLREQGMFVGPLFLNLLMIAVTGPITFCSILWFTSGTLLARFECELGHHKDATTTDWDNYIDRIINSGDELEREHLFIGTSESGDYPMLVHQEIHDQHCHILGDSGASKTALGIAPQVTQKIARGDCTVVVVDLKGDKALFETCRREAARNGNMRFRWVSNEVGKTTFAFNPFIQTHNSRLSVEQLTQQLLQGLSLDYGIQYGAGYFTAMNEIVLNNVLQETGARSFRELSEHLSDRKWYSTIGHEDDWKQARHLAALVKRLAGSEPINVVPGMHSDQPDVHEQAIDATNLFEEPQVIYLWLRSAVEPTNAPAVARLFLWAMFTAASHQRLDKNRVYLFVDEMQQIISDGIKLIFEQFRDMGGTIIAAHQTAGQLHRQGTDLGATVESCTAVKQVFRASDIDSLERLEKLSGSKREIVPTWYQTYERGTGDLTERYDPLLAREGLVRVAEQDRPRHEWGDLLAISSRRHSSLVRFTFGSGYTQFAGATVPIVSQYHITFDEYKRRRTQPWPTAVGAFPILRPGRALKSKDHDQNGGQGKPVRARRTAEESTFAREFEERGERFKKK